LQSPTIIFDHINQTVAILGGGAVADRKLAELAAAQQSQLATSGQPKP
jgi:siroheme synthase (precorrin-2 oxidase/ferrochelatase)